VEQSAQTASATGHHFRQLNRSLKTFMFGEQGRGALWLDVKDAD